MSDPIVLKPAKPYAGKAQWQAIRAALAPFQDAGVVSMERFGNGRIPQASVSPRSRKMVAKVYCEVAQLSVTKPRYLREYAAEGIEAAFIQITTALLAAGWTVEIEGDNHAIVYGPGINGWAKAERQRLDDIERQRSDTASRQQAEAMEMNAVLAKAGVVARASTDRWGQTVAALSLADFRKLGLL